MPHTPKMLTEFNRIVTGFHGTSVQKAAGIVRAGAFQLSKNDYDWLGHGAYFWEYAPYRAWDWAKQKHGSNAAVVEAEVRLGHCLDLTDIRYTNIMQVAFDGLREAYNAKGLAIPVNRGKARRLDCMVINYVAEYIFPECETARAAFLEGPPMFEGSDLLSASHIQIVVRKPVGTIKRIRMASRIDGDGQ